MKNSNTIYPPIVELIKNCGIDKMRNLLRSNPPNSLLTPAKLTKSSEIQNKYPSSGYYVKYCGSISTGSEGDVKQIEKAIWNLLQSGDKKLIPVKFECLEIGIKVTLDSDDSVSFSFYIFFYFFFNF